jgi:ribose transport system permease protein
MSTETPTAAPKPKSTNSPSPDAAAPRSGLRASTGLAIYRVKDYGIVAVALALFAALSLSSDYFLTKSNFLNILNQWSAIGIVAFAVTYVLIAGGFDLSVASVFSLSGVVAAKLVSSIGVVPALLVGIAVGLVMGIVNGVIVVVWQVNSIIATLASGFVLAGLALKLSNGTLVSVSNPAFTKFGSTVFWGMPLPNWYLIIAALVLAFVLHRTTFGRYLFASGDNASAAVLAGIRVAWVRISAFGISGLAAGFAGVMVASQQSTGQANALPNMEFDVLAAVIVGGTSILGGAGAVWRTCVGVLLLAFIRNGSDLLGIDSNYEQMIYGGIILGAAALDVWARRRARRA